jgi:hypothetical protein
MFLFYTASYSLIGFSDPVYAEAYVDVHQYDILLGMPVVCVILFHSLTVVMIVHIDIYHR